MVSINSHEIKQTQEPHKKHLSHCPLRSCAVEKEAEWNETKEVKITTKEPEVLWTGWTERVYLWVFTKVVNRPSSLRSKFEAVSHSTRKPSERTRTRLASKMWDTRCWKKEQKNRWVKEGSAVNVDRKEWSQLREESYILTCAISLGTLTLERQSQRKVRFQPEGQCSMELKDNNLTTRIFIIYTAKNLGAHCKWAGLSGLPDTSYSLTGLKPESRRPDCNL